MRSKENPSAASANYSLTSEDVAKVITPSPSTGEGDIKQCVTLPLDLTLSHNPLDNVLLRYAHGEVRGYTPDSGTRLAKGTSYGSEDQYK